MSKNPSESNYISWGKQPQLNQNGIKLIRQDYNLQKFSSSILAYGNGRSYGDSCLNSEGIVLDTRDWDQFIKFDPLEGTIEAHSGLLLSDILEIIVPKGWFLPVCPGTKYITLGGAIANDIHGKNHHSAGTFGMHVLELELLRSNGERKICSNTKNQDLFHATIAGLGLTGLITKATIKLKPISSPFLDLELIKFKSLEEFLQLSVASDQGYEYTVAWFDCMVSSHKDSCGIFMRANHSKLKENLENNPSKEYNVFFTPPFSFVNNFTMKIFNELYYHKQFTKTKHTRMHYNPFFYPLDSVNNWNRLYGPNGFVQFQFVIPELSSIEIIDRILKLIAKHKTGSSLSVLKIFGTKKSPGLLSFPRPGITLAMDFPYRGQATLDFLAAASAIIDQAGGAIYPAKDMQMSAHDFKRAYPRYQDFVQYIDPKFSSNFWRRVNA